MGGGGWFLRKSLTRKQQKKKKPKSAVNSTENKLILDRRSCKKLHKRVRFGSPVFITSGIYIFKLS